MKIHAWVVVALVCGGGALAACDDADSDDGGGSGGSAAGGSGGSAAGGSGGSAAGGSGGSAAGGSGGAGGSATGGAGGSATGGSGGAVADESWLEVKVDGVVTRFTFVTAAAESRAVVNLALAELATNTSVNILVGDAVNGVATATTYDCTPGGQGLTYVGPGVEMFYANAQTGSCAVSFSEIGQAVGARVKGTFSATVNNAGGTATHELTEGSFDAVLVGSMD